MPNADRNHLTLAEGKQSTKGYQRRLEAIEVLSSLKLTATEVNLLAALTSWCVVSLEQIEVFSRLFVDA